MNWKDNYHSVRVNGPEEYRISQAGLIIVTGPSSSGKSTISYNILRNLKAYFSGPEFTQIVIIYQFQQELYEQIRKSIKHPKVVFIQGYKETLFDTYYPPGTLFLFDDLDAEIFESPAFLKQAVGSFHHNKITAIVTTQSLFHPRSKHANIILKNAHAYLITRLRKELHSLITFGTHCGLPKGLLLDAYHTCINRSTHIPHVLLNFSPRIKSIFTLQGNIVKPLTQSTTPDLSRDLEKYFESNFPLVFPVPGSMDASSSASSSKSKPSGEKFFFLLSEKDMQKLASQFNAATTTSEPSRTLGNRPKSEAWRQVLSSIDSMQTLSSNTRVRMKRIAQVLIKQGFMVGDDSNLVIPSGESPEEYVEGSGTVVEVLLFFALPNALDSPRPRELYSIVNHLRKNGVSVGEGFHAEKQPGLLLNQIKRSITKKRKI